MNPVRDSLETLEITEEDIITLREYDPAAAARVYTERIQYIDGQQKRTFTELGLIMIEVESRELYKLVADASGVTYKSLGRWITEAAPVCRSNCYAAMEAMKALKEEIAPADLRDMPRCNVLTLKKLSSKVRQEPAVIEAAKELSENDFKAKIAKEHPEQHVEKDSPMRFKPTEGARMTVDRALEVAAWVYGIEGRENALEGICSYFLDSACEREDSEGKSNRIAFETRAR